MKILSSPILLFLILAGALSANFVSATEKIDINNAPLEDLVKIVHIGEARAKELISLRPFSSLDDLTRIRGIGHSRVEDIKKQGLAWFSTGVKSSEVKPQPDKDSSAELNEASSLAAIGEQITEASSSLPILLIALCLAIFSGIIILLLKKKIKIGYNKKV